MRVLQLISDTDRRGAQVFAVDLQGELRRLGDEVTTVALVPGASDERLEVGVLGPTRWSVRGQLALRRLALSHDVVIAHGSSTALASTFGMGRTSTPVVYRQVSDSKVWANTRARRIRVQAYLRRMCHVVALWTESSRDLTDHLGVPRSKITIIPNGVRTAGFVRSSVDGVGDRTARRLRVGYLGALTEEKGMGELCWLAEQLPEVDFALAGDGPLLARLRAEAPPNLSVMGPTSHPAGFLAALDLFVFPSWSESMPAVVIEASLTGLPMVVTDVGAVRELVLDGVSGFVVPARDRLALLDGLRRLLDDRELRIGFGEAAAEHGLMYGMEVVGERYHELLQQLVGPPTV